MTEEEERAVAEARLSLKRNGGIPFEQAVAETRLPCRKSAIPGPFVIKRVVLSTEAQADLAALDRTVALRSVAAVNRFAATRFPPPRRRLARPLPRPGDWIDVLRVRNRKEAYRFPQAASGLKPEASRIGLQS